jgi:hypothetical protein
MLVRMTAKPFALRSFFLGLVLCAATAVAADPLSVYGQGLDSRPSLLDEDDTTIDEFIEMSSRPEAHEFDRFLTDVQRSLIQLSQSSDADPGAGGAPQREALVRKMVNQHLGRGRFNYLPPPYGLRDLPPEILRPILHRSSPAAVRSLRDSLAGRGSGVLIEEATRADLRHSRRMALQGWVGPILITTSAIGVVGAVGAVGLFADSIPEQTPAALALTGTTGAALWAGMSAAIAKMERVASRFYGRYRLLDSMDFARAQGVSVPRSYRRFAKDHCGSLLRWMFSRRPVR